MENPNFMFHTDMMTSSVHGIGAVVLVLLLPLGGSQPVVTGNPNPTPAEYQHFSPSLALTMTGIVVALFFLVFLFAVYVRYCDDGSISGSVRAIAGLRPATRGLDRSVIDTFPTFPYSAVRALKIGKGALECAVCISEFDDDQTLRLIPNCDHVFHPDCIDAWLANHSTCPVCRADLLADPPPPPPIHHDQDPQVIPVQPVVVLGVNETLNRNRTRGRPRNKLPRSHSTGHSYPVQPGGDSDRFRLRLPAEVRRQIMMNRQLHRANSMVALPTEGSSRRGYRRLDSPVKSDRWVFSMAPPFLTRALSAKLGEGESPILGRAKSAMTCPTEDWGEGQSPV